MTGAWHDERVALVLPDRMLEPVRRWALRELKVHPRQVVVVVGCRAPWVLSVLRGLVQDTGAVLVFETDAERRRRAEAEVHAQGWSNVAVVAQGPRDMELPRSADRVLLDDDWPLATGEDVQRLVSLLGPSGRIAAVCRRGSQPCAQLKDRLAHPRRETFYLGGAYALWGQIP
jgi:precorrin-6B methylase 2